MKRFLVILAILFGVPCGAGAALQCQSGSFSVDNQDLQKNEKCYIGDGFVELIIHFKTGSAVVDQTAYADVKDWLASYEKDIGHVVIIGSADMQQYSNPAPDANNIDLAELRVERVMPLLPQSISTACNLAFGGIETTLCSIYVTGDANDIAAAVQGRKQPNPDERVVRIYVIWRSAQCSDTLVEKLPIYKEMLKNCAWVQSKYKGDLSLLDVCSSVDVFLHGNRLSALTEFLAEAGVYCGGIQEINNEVGISIEIAYQKINKFFNGLGLSVWRDRDGNFNTARLASDSIAAVVLGTAGGLITSKLVKKNQIKKGFEDLNCSVGGHRVAAFGDEFSVGLQ